MDEVLEAIQELRNDLNISKIAYVTIDLDYDCWDYETTHVYTDPSKIPYLNDYNDVTMEDLEKLEIGDSIIGDDFRIIKTRVN